MCSFCGSKNYKKNGFFHNHLEKIQKYFCKNCLSHFTDEIENKFEKKQELNNKIIELSEKGLSQREIAKRLNICRWTVQLKQKKHMD